MKFFDILGSRFRNYTNSPQKIEELKGGVRVYLEIENTVDKIESDAISIMEDNNYGEWIVNEARKSRLEYQFMKGNVSDEDFLAALQVIEKNRDSILETFINNSSDDLIVFAKDKLFRIKRENSGKYGINEMNFDDWANMQLSAEKSRSIRYSIEGSSKYADAEKVADYMWRYQRDQHLRK